MAQVRRPRGHAQRRQAQAPAARRGRRGHRGGRGLPRKVIQLVVHPDAEYSPGMFSQGIFIALCDDGTIWDRQLKYDRVGRGPATNYRYEWEQIQGPPEET